jgi:hypothetical protein
MSLEALSIPYAALKSPEWWAVVVVAIATIRIAERYHALIPYKSQVLENVIIVNWDRRKSQLTITRLSRS